MNAGTSDILLPSAHLRNYLVNLSVWFRPYKVECVNIPSTNQSDTCSYSVFNESVPFKDGLYEFALSPHNSTLLSIPVLYTVYPRPTTTVPPMSSMPGNNGKYSVCLCLANMPFCLPYFSTYPSTNECETGAYHTCDVITERMRYIYNRHGVFTEGTMCIQEIWLSGIHIQHSEYIYNTWSRFIAVRTPLQK